MFKHSPLTTPSSFRILTLLPSKSVDSPLTIELKEVKFDDDVRFEALSYAWEGQTPSQQIGCNQEVFLITRTCESALRSLRRKFHQRFLWIDSICIDQDSVEEKNHQVGLMGIIYSSAVRVVVWLGDRQPQRDIIFKDVRKYMRLERIQKILKLGDIPYIRKQGQGQWKIQRGYDEIGKSWQKQAGVTAEHVLDSFPWIHRAWTIQEISLAKAVEVRYENFVEDYDLFMEMLSRCMVRLWLTDHNTGGYSIETNDTRYIITLKRLLRKLIQERRNGRFKDWDLVYILRLISSTKSSIAADKIFAINGLLTELGMDLPEPDYSTHHGQIYWNFAILAANHANSVEFLGITDGAQWAGIVPSWVPDFNNSSKRFSPSSGFWNNVPVFESNFGFSEDRKLLYVKAFIMSTVKEKAKTQTEFQSLKSENLNQDPLRDYTAVIQTLQSWIDLAKTIGLLDGNPQYYKSLRELVFGREETTIKEVLDFKPQAEDLFLWMLSEAPDALKILAKAILHDRSESYQNYRADVSSQLNPVSTELVHSLLDNGFIPMQTAMERSHNVTAFTTLDGFIGTGPLSLEEGDVLARVGDAREVIILRAVGSHFTVIGPSFIPELTRQVQKTYFSGEGKQAFVEPFLVDLILE